MWWIFSSAPGKCFDFALWCSFKCICFVIIRWNIGVSHIVEPPPQGNDFFPLIVESTNRYVDGQLRGLVAPSFSFQGSNFTHSSPFLDIYLSTSGLSRKMDPLPSPGKWVIFLSFLFVSLYTDLVSPNPGVFMDGWWDSDIRRRFSLTWKTSYTIQARKHRTITFLFQPDGQLCECGGEYNICSSLVVKITLVQLQYNRKAS